MAWSLLNFKGSMVFCRPIYNLFFWGAIQVVLVQPTFATQTATCAHHLERIGAALENFSGPRSPDGPPRTSQELLDRAMMILNADKLPTTPYQKNRWEMALHLLGRSFDHKDQLSQISRETAFERLFELSNHSDLDAYTKHLVNHVIHSFVSRDAYSIPTPADPSTPTDAVGIAVEIHTTLSNSHQNAFLELLDRHSDAVTYEKHKSAVTAIIEDHRSKIRQAKESVANLKNKLSRLASYEKAEIIRLEANINEQNTLALLTQKKLDVMLEILNKIEAWRAQKR